MFEGSKLFSLSYIPVYTAHKVFTYLSLYKTSSSCTRLFYIDIPTLLIVPFSEVVIRLLLGRVTKLKLYLAEVEAIVAPLAVIPDIGGPSKWLLCGQASAAVAEGFRCVVA